MRDQETAQLVSIQVGSLRPVVIAGRQRMTGIHKQPAATVFIGKLGLENDAIGDVRNHGGPDQAVYLYSEEDYDWWETELGARPVPGQFGENLTLSSFGAREPMVGDRWQIGEVLLEVTAPRIPCSTFGAAMNDVDFPKRFRLARRPGFYTRVLHEGKVESGITAVKTPAERNASIGEMFDLAYETNAEPAVWQRLLAAPIAERVRVDYQRRLERSRGL